MRQVKRTTCILAAASMLLGAWGQEAMPTAPALGATALAAPTQTAARLTEKVADGTALRLTMDECIGYAVAHAASVRMKAVEAASARADVSVALSGFLPSVYASTAGQYSWGRNVDPETNTYSTVTTFNNHYQLSASLSVFDGGQTINRFRQARLARRQGLTQLQQAEDEVAIDVMQKYVDAAYAQRCVALAEAKLAESQGLLQRTRLQEELGVKGRPDVAQMEAQVAEDDYGLTHQRNQARLAMLALATAMNYEGDALLEATLDAGDVEPSADASTLGGREASSAERGLASADGLAATGLLPEAVSAELRVRSAVLDYRIQKGRLWPSLSLSAGVATSYFRNVAGGGPATPFRSQLRDNVGEYVSASLSLPVFELSRLGQVRRARLGVGLARLEREETLRRLSDEARRAAMDCEGYGLEVEKMVRRVASDSLAYHLSRRKYEEGVLSTFDLQTASRTLLESRIRLLQSQMLLGMKRRLVAYYRTGVIYNK